MTDLIQTIKESGSPEVTTKRDAWVIYSEKEKGFFKDAEEDLSEIEFSDVLQQAILFDDWDLAEAVVEDINTNYSDLNVGILTIYCSL